MYHELWVTIAYYSRILCCLSIHHQELRCKTNRADPWQHMSSLVKYHDFGVNMSQPLWVVPSSLLLQQANWLSICLSIHPKHPKNIPKEKSEPSPVAPKLPTFGHHHDPKNIPKPCHSQVPGSSAPHEESCQRSWVRRVRDPDSRSGANKKRWVSVC